MDRIEPAALNARASFVAPDNLIETLGAAVSEAKLGDPMRRVHVVTPSHAAAQSLSRALARAVGVVNTDFLGLEYLASNILREAGLDDARKTLTGERQRELARIVSAQARPPLSNHMSSTVVEALVRSFTELRNRSNLEIEALADTGELAAELVRLFGEFRLLAARFDDARDLIERAEQYVSADSAPVVAVIMQPLLPHESSLLQVLSNAGRLIVIAPLTGDSEADDALTFALNGLGARSMDDVAFPQCDSISIAPDAEIEVQLAVSQVLEKAEQGTPFARMALLYSAQSPYALIVGQQLSASGIPIGGRSPMKLAQSAVGRFVLTLLEAIESDYAIDAMAEWFSSAPIHPPDNYAVINAPEWVDAARRARVARGSEHWTTRLNGYRDECARRYPSRAIAANECSTFVADFIAWASPNRSSWEQWAAWMQSAINRYLSTENESDTWPRSEVQAKVDIEELLAGLGRLDDLGARVDRTTFIAALTGELARKQKGGRIAEGLFVGSVADAAGCEFEFTAICGVSEGLLPAATADGSLLAALRVPGQERRVDIDRRYFLAAVASAKSCVLSTASADQRAQRELRPSPWLLEQAKMLNGSTVTAASLLDPEDSYSWLRRVPSLTATLAPSFVPTDTAHVELRALNAASATNQLREHELVASCDDLNRGLIAIDSRSSDEFTRFDGFSGPYVLSEGLSPTALEEWALCPFKFFLSSVLGIDQGIDEEDQLKFAGKERGNLVHKALEEFVKSVPERTSPDEPWTTAERAQLHAIAADLCETIRSEGNSPEGLLWEAELLNLHRNLDAFLDDDEALRKSKGVITSHENLEVAFGRGDAPPVVIERSVGTPVVFRGRIDRVDSTPDRKHNIAIDYKTSKAKYLQDIEPDPVAAGQRLQLALYAEAVALGVDDPDATVEAFYWFITDSAADYPQVGINLDAGTRERLQEVVDAMSTGIESGAFLLFPGEEDRNSFTNCRFCPYDSLCPVDRAEAWERKYEDPKIQPFLGLDLEVEA